MLQLNTDRSFIVRKSAAFEGPSKEGGNQHLKIPALEHHFAY